MISHWLGWIAVVIGVSELLVYFARKYSSPVLKHLRGKHHMAWGRIMLIVCLVHGISFGLGDFLTLNWGTIGCLCIALLLLTYGQRKKIGTNWLKVHGILSVILTVCVFIHVVIVT